MAAADPRCRVGPGAPAGRAATLSVLCEGARSQLSWEGTPSLRLPCRGPCGMPTPAPPQPGPLLAWPPVSRSAAKLISHSWRATGSSHGSGTGLASLPLAQPMGQAPTAPECRGVTSGPALACCRVQPSTSPPQTGSRAEGPGGQSPLVGAQPGLAIAAPIRLLTASHQRPSLRVQGHSSAQHGAAIGRVSGIDTAPVTAQPRHHVPWAPQGNGACQPEHLHLPQPSGPPLLWASHSLPSPCPHMPTAHPPPWLPEEQRAALHPTAGHDPSSIPLLVPHEQGLAPTDPVMGIGQGTSPGSGGNPGRQRGMRGPALAAKPHSLLRTPRALSPTSAPLRGSSPSPRGPAEQPPSRSDSTHLPGAPTALPCPTDPVLGTLPPLPLPRGPSPRTAPPVLPHTPLPTDPAPPDPVHGLCPRDPAPRSLPRTLPHGTPPPGPAGRAPALTSAVAAGQAAAPRVAVGSAGGRGAVAGQRGDGEPPAHGPAASTSVSGPRRPPSAAPPGADRGPSARGTARRAAPAAAGLARLGSARRARPARLGWAR